MSVCLCAADAQSPRESPVCAETAAVLSIPALPHPSCSARGLGFSPVSGEQVRKIDLITNLREGQRISFVLWVVCTTLRSIKEAVSVGRLKWPQVPVWALS